MRVITSINFRYNVMVIRKVFSSDFRDSCHDLPRTTPSITVKKGSKEFTFHQSYEYLDVPTLERFYEYGNIFGNITFAEQRREDSETRENPYRHVELKRSRRNIKQVLDVSPLFKENYDMEVLLHPFMVNALLPVIFQDGYSFWKTGENVIRGYAEPPRSDLEYVWEESKRDSGNSVLNQDQGSVQEDKSRWWRGSELYIRLYRDPSGGTNAVVERIQQPNVFSDCADYDNSPTMKDLRIKEQVCLCW